MSKLVLAAVLAIVAAAPAAAETCGDANGNDTVTVTDGVQALRAAASLSSTCDDACDVDGSGAISVTDGVNILRKAAGFAINEACDFTNQEANGLTNPSLSIFDGLTKVPGFGSSDAAAAAVGDCENDGTVETTAPGPNTSVTTFTDCEINGAVLDGQIGRAVLAQGVALAFQGFTITKLASGRTLTITGQLGVQSAQAGQRVAGKLTIVSSERGTFTIEFQRILIVGDGSVRDGILIYDLTDASTPKVAGIRINFGEGDEIPVQVLLRNKQVRQLILDRNLRTLRRLG